MRSKHLQFFLFAAGIFTLSAITYLAYFSGISADEQSDRTKSGISVVYDSNYTKNPDYPLTSKKPYFGFFPSPPCTPKDLKGCKVPQATGDDRGKSINIREIRCIKHGIGEQARIQCRGKVERIITLLHLKNIYIPPIPCGPGRYPSEFNKCPRKNTINEAISNSVLNPYEDIFGWGAWGDFADETPTYNPPVVDNNPINPDAPIYPFDPPKNSVPNQTNAPKPSIFNQIANFFRGLFSIRN